MNRNLINKNRGLSSIKEGLSHIYRRFMPWNIGSLR